MTKDSGTFFTSAPVARNGNSAQAWFTTIFAKQEDFPEMQLTGIAFTQGRQAANCADNSMALVQSAWYDENSKLLRSFANPQATFAHVTPGTLGEAKLNILCRRAQTLVDSKPLVGDIDYIALYFLELLHEATRTTGQQ